MKQEQMKIWERFLKGLLVMTGILFIELDIYSGILDFQKKISLLYTF